MIDILIILIPPVVLIIALLFKPESIENWTSIILGAVLGYVFSLLGLFYASVIQKRKEKFSVTYALQTLCFDLEELYDYIKSNDYGEESFKYIINETLSSINNYLVVYNDFLLQNSTSYSVKKLSYELVKIQDTPLVKKIARDHLMASYLEIRVVLKTAVDLYDEYLETRNSIVNAVRALGISTISYPKKDLDFLLKICTQFESKYKVKEKILDLTSWFTEYGDLLGDFFNYDFIDNCEDQVVCDATRQVFEELSDFRCTKLPKDTLMKLIENNDYCGASKILIDIDRKAYDCINDLLLEYEDRLKNLKRKCNNLTNINNTVVSIVEQIIKEIYKKSCPSVKKNLEVSGYFGPLVKKVN